jgi:pimeloyl-ACP methyl ester carboxylesterase
VTSLYIDDVGAGSAVVLAHGVAQDTSIFEPQREALRNHFRVLTWDAPGHGRSPRRNGPYDHAALADDIAAALAERHIERAVVGGLSQGGWVALHVALRHPDLVAGLVLMSCSAHPLSAETVAPVRAGVATWAADGLTDGYAQYQSHNNLGPGSSHTAAWIERIAQLDGNDYIEPYEALITRPDLQDRLAEIDAPTLIIRGEHDVWAPANEVAAMARGLRGATLVTVPAAWHTLTLTHPADVNAAMSTFLDDLPAW